MDTYIEKLENFIKRNEIETFLEDVYSFFTEKNQTTLKNEVLIELGMYKNIQNLLHSHLINHQEYLNLIAKANRKAIFFKDNVCTILNL